MTDLPSFLSWFEGFAENIDGAPTEKQWGRIKAKIEGLQGQPVARTVTSTGSSTPVASMVVAPPKVIIETSEQWLAAVRKELIGGDGSFNVDAETATEIMAGTTVEMHRDPKDVVAEIAKQYGAGG